MARVVFEQVSKAFIGPQGERIQAVRDFSVAIAEREFVVLAGPSGCGKTTTLRLLAGLEELTSGTIAIDDRVVNDLEPKDREAAMVFQNYALYPHMSVFENLAFGLRLRNLPKSEIAQRVGTAADTLGLTPVLDRLPPALSGGERQRVAVGRAMVLQPRVFLFDEPLSNLDATLRGQLRLELKRLHTRLGATTIYVTHDQVEAMSLGDRLVVMKEGMIQQVAAPREIYARPANLFVAGFIGSPPMNFFRGTLEAGAESLRFRLAGPSGTADPSATTLSVAPAHCRRLAPWVGHAIVLGLRPEAILPTASGGGLPHTERVSVEIELVECLGAETYVHGLWGSARLTARWPAGTLPSRGEKLTVWFDLAEAHYFDALSEKAIGGG